MEFVYVVKRADLFPLRYPQGLELRDAAEMSGLVERIRERGFFLERRQAEQDSSFKQIIPYAVLVRGGREVFAMRRLSAGGEARLHGKRSIGVGGHVNPIDACPPAGGGAAPAPASRDPVAAALAREIEEEVELARPWVCARAVGLLNDDSTDVGSVHVGLVQLVEVVGDVRVRETDTLEGGFQTVEDLTAACRSDRGSFETWSAFVIDALPELV